MSIIRTRNRCALCSSEHLVTVLSLPATPPANEFVSEPQTQDSFPLDLQLCESCGHVQLADVVHPSRLFSNYVYVSGTSSVFVQHFENYAREVYTACNLSPKSLVVDIGSNDGTLLKAFKATGVGSVAGVDPAKNIALKAQTEGIPTYVGFFDRKMAERILLDKGAANLITANNVFAHADDLHEIAMGVHSLLAPAGVFVFEVSYLLDVVEKTLFDTIYHEHLSYHSVKPLIPFLEKCGLNVYDAQRVDTHGGSIRVYASRTQRPQSERLISLLEAETKAGIQSPIVFKKLQNNIKCKADQLTRTIRESRANGKKICGFGAPAKLTTLMYSFGLKATDFEFIIDDSPLKQGLYTPGLNIPVKPSTALYTQGASVCVVFAWNFFSNICEKHSQWVQTGGTFINPLN